MAVRPRDLLPEDLRAFAQRDRSEPDRLGRRLRAERYRASGGSVTLEIGHALYEHARSVRPDYPSRRERERDLRDHVELKRLLDRTSGVFRLR